MTTENDRLSLLTLPSPSETSIVMHKSHGPAELRGCAPVYCWTLATSAGAHSCPVIFRGGEIIHLRQFLTLQQQYQRPTRRTASWPLPAPPERLRLRGREQRGSRGTARPRAPANTERRQQPPRNRPVPKMASRELGY